MDFRPYIHDSRILGLAPAHVRGLLSGFKVLGSNAYLKSATVRILGLKSAPYIREGISFTRTRALQTVTLAHAPGLGIQTRPASSTSVNETNKRGRIGRRGATCLNQETPLTNTDHRRIDMANKTLPATVIELTKGYAAIIDAEDAERVASHRWYASGSGHRVYGMRNADDTTRLLHRFILNTPEGVHVDHINGNTLDNRKANLRLCTHAENMANRRSDPSKCSGAWFDNRKGLWRAEIRRLGTRRRLGYFKTKQEAEDAYQAAALLADTI
jgi:hypothetical protein